RPAACALAAPAGGEAPSPSPVALQCQGLVAHLDAWSGWAEALGGPAGEEEAPEGGEAQFLAALRGRVADLRGFLSRRGSESAEAAPRAARRGGGEALAGGCCRAGG
ncbi:unnamed protein product, partial [Prorocentrum cordatum]